MSKTYIVLHHSASPDHPILMDFDSIKRWHTEHNGWRDIGYHWVIEWVDNKLVALPGRPEWDTGAHCPGRNQDGIGICIVGNFQESEPDPEIYPFVADLCRQIINRHPIKEIGGHRDYYATACPGQYFDVERVRRLVKGDDIVTVDDALKVLVDQGVISSPDYWRNAAGCVKYLDVLLINMAKKLQGQAN